MKVDKTTDTITKILYGLSGIFLTIQTPIRAPINIKGNKLADAVTVVSNTHYFTLAESLGGVESLCGHPASMTHAAIPKEEREKTGVADSLIRLSVGVEDIADLVADLEQALAKL